MPKQLIFGETARANIMKGVDKLADSVKETLTNMTGELHMDGETVGRIWARMQKDRLEIGELPEEYD